MISFLVLMFFATSIGIVLLLLLAVALQFIEDRW